MQILMGPECKIALQPSRKGLSRCRPSVYQALQALTVVLGIILTSLESASANSPHSSEEWNEIGSRIAPARMHRKFMPLAPGGLVHIMGSFPL
jgi:hypothetical protein